jgi:hypothetical protein
MIDKTKPEFVLSLNRHVDMPAPFRFLVDSAIPFLAEKPWAIDDKTVNELADYAELIIAPLLFPLAMRSRIWAWRSSSILSSCSAQVPQSEISRQRSAIWNKDLQHP